jgi:hypothetical protein
MSIEDVAMTLRTFPSVQTGAENSRGESSHAQFLDCPNKVSFGVMAPYGDG